MIPAVTMIWNSEGFAMLTDLVEVNTTDDLSLSGAYFAAQGESKLGIDSLIYFHGDGGHFYSRLLLRLGQLFSAEGVAFLALGLGKTIADGEKSLRYCPAHPEILPQYYSIKSTLNKYN